MDSGSVEHVCKFDDGKKVLCIDGILTKCEMPPRYRVCYCDCHDSAGTHTEAGPLYSEPPRPLGPDPLYYVPGYGPRQG